MERVYADINGAVLKWARERARYLPEQLAGKVGTSASKYIEWETGRSKPTMRQLYLLVRALNQPLQEK